MSGGHFNYSYAKVQSFAEELKRAIHDNVTPDEHGYYHEFGEDALILLSSIVRLADVTALLMKEAEWLYSGDTPEYKFISNVQGIINGTKTS